MSSVTVLEEYMPEIPRMDTRRFKITIRDGNGNLTDPDWVQLEFKKPGAADTPYGPYSAAKASQGVYCVDFKFPDGTSLGEWIRIWTWMIEIAGAFYPGKYESPLHLVDLTEEFDTFGS